MQRPLFQFHEPFQLRRNTLRHRSTTTHLPCSTPPHSRRHRHRHHRHHNQLLSTIRRQQVQLSRPYQHNTIIRYNSVHEPCSHRQRIQARSKSSSTILQAGFRRHTTRLSQLPVQELRQLNQHRTGLISRHMHQRQLNQHNVRITNNQATTNTTITHNHSRITQVILLHNKQHITTQQDRSRADLRQLHTSLRQRHTHANSNRGAAVTTWTQVAFSVIRG